MEDRVGVVRTNAIFECHVVGCDIELLMLGALRDFCCIP